MISSTYSKLINIISIFFILFSLTTPVKIFAHPVDNTDYYLYFNQEADGSFIPENELSGYLYINWYQAAALVQPVTGQNALELDMEELVKYDDIYQDYVKNHLSLENNGQLCALTFFTVAQDPYEYPLDLGKRILMNFKCEEPLNSLKMKNTLFLDTFEFSTNYVSLFKGEMLIDRIETNKYFNEFTISMTGDGLAKIDKPENFVSTNGAVSPLDPNYNNQTFMKEKVSVLDKLKGFIENLKKVGDVGSMNPFYLLILLFLLGFLHTMEAGHSKVVLTSAMLHKNMSIKGGILYAIVFTVTHIGDILLLGLALLIVNNFVDVYSKFSILEKAAAYGLLFIGIYLLFKSISDLIQQRFNKSNVHVHDHHHDHDHHHNHDHHHGLMHSHDGHTHSHDYDPHKSFKSQLIVGFLSGLAPCVFGWSILMLIVSAKKLWLLIPAILTFSLGIFSALLIVVFIVGKFKGHLVNKFGWLAEISPLISATILVAYAFYIIS